MRAALERAKELAEAIELCDLRATTDPRNLVAPCVLIVPPTLQPLDVGYASLSATWSLHVIAQGLPGGDAWTILNDHLSVLLNVIVEQVGGFTEAHPDFYYPAFGGLEMALPCYTITFDDTVQWSVN